MKNDPTLPVISIHSNRTFMMCQLGPLEETNWFFFSVKVYCGPFRSQKIRKMSDSIVNLPSGTQSSIK